MNNFLANLFDLLTNPEFLSNILLLTFVSIYAVFALVLTLQIKRLTQTVSQKRFSSVFQLVSLIHAVMAILLIFIVAAVI